MRVTRAIREYVEDEIRKKYDDAEQEIGKEYEAEKAKVLDMLTKIMDKAQGEALEYLKLVGFEFKPCYRSEHLFSLSGSVGKQDIEDEIYRQKNIIRSKRYDKTKQVLFDLEMGETGKAQLKEVLDNITVD